MFCEKYNINIYLKGIIQNRYAVKYISILQIIVCYITCSLYTLKSVVFVNILVVVSIIIID